MSTQQIALKFRIYGIKKRTRKKPSHSNILGLKIQNFFWLFCNSINTLVLAKHSSRIHQQSIWCFLPFWSSRQSKELPFTFLDKINHFLFVFHYFSLVWTQKLFDVGVRPSFDKTSVFFFMQCGNFSWSYQNRILMFVGYHTIEL